MDYTINLFLTAVYNFTAEIYVKAKTFWFIGDHAYTG